MKRKIVIPGLCFIVLLSVGWILLAAKQQQKKIINDACAPAARRTRESKATATGKTVAAAQALLARWMMPGVPKSVLLSTALRNPSGRISRVGIYPRNGLRLGDLSCRAARSGAETPGHRFEQARAAKSERDYGRR